MAGYKRQGAFVFVGGFEPSQTERVTAFVDPGLPPWLADDTFDHLDQLFTMYAGWIDHPLTFRPIVFVSRDEDGRGRNLKGGTLPRQMQLAADGEGWNEPSEEGDRHWYGFLAHEAFHFWTSQLFERTGGRWEEWASEGLADWYAMRAMREAGVVDDAGYDDLLVAAANRCLLRWPDGPLLEGKRPYGTFYACSSVLVAGLDGELRARDASLDAILHATWSKVETTGPWSTMSLLHTLQNELEDPLIVGPLTDVLFSGPRGTVHDTMAQALSAAGVEATTGTEAVLAEHEWRRALTRQLEACGCPATLERDRKGWTLSAEPCLAESREVDGVPLDDLRGSYFAVVKRIADRDCPAGATAFFVR